jgi:hypothetical protein
MELIGEMAADQLQDTAQLFRPFVLQCGGPGAIALFDMTRSDVISGDSIEKWRDIFSKTKIRTCRARDLPEPFWQSMLGRKRGD